ncbi:uncharacterized protein C16orf46 homolog [Echeneis naucrates]|uniref:uncharacterized protein C16orf46 homolog n=1 Tax=Echeneis naucrates TaxID=173247 RepID=UPI001113E7EC|nr:uncharacterized protein LOC115041540 [Echeneis naucrates]XP_029354928.1 uncharacterized protein LOC115041540 [Echeneis naucrates]
MATSGEAAQSGVIGPDEHPPAEDAAGEESDRTPERRHVDTLLDISEEDFLKEQEPHEYHCYSGLEEAVRGWGRVAPMSCILLTQKRCRKPKLKEAGNMAPTSVDQTSLTADSSASCESHAGYQDYIKKTMTVNHQVGPTRSAAATALLPDASDLPVLCAMQKTMSHHLLENIKEESLNEMPVQPHNLSLKYSVSENRLTKPPRATQRHNNTVVPIKNFTFLPPIKSPHLNPTASGQLYSGKKASEGETSKENSFMSVKSETTGTRVDSTVHTEIRSNSVALNSKYCICQHNPHLFSAVTVNIPKMYKLPCSPKPDTVQHMRHSQGKNLRKIVNISPAASAHTRMHPSCLFSEGSTLHSHAV